MQMLQQEITGEAERTGLTSEDDVMELVKELRNFKYMTCTKTADRE